MSGPERLGASLGSTPGSTLGASLGSSLGSAMSYAVLGEDCPAQSRAEAWFATISGGSFAPRGVRVDALVAATRSPAQTRHAVHAAVSGLDPGPRALAAAAGGLVVVVTEAGSPAHTWTLPGGGVRLLGRTWCLRYAALPVDAPLGTFAHELGHLLLGWPDLPLAFGQDCLMALGGHRGGGEQPALPGAALRVAAGWETPLPADATTLVADLLAAPRESGRCYRLPDGDLAERIGPRILVVTPGEPPALPPRLRRRVPLTDRDEARPLLAVLASG